MRTEVAYGGGMSADRTAERDAAWARLVLAQEAFWTDIRSTPCGADVTDLYKAIAEARQALRALGVNVDYLLGENEARDALLAGPR